MYALIFLTILSVSSPETSKNESCSAFSPKSAEWITLPPLEITNEISAKHYKLSDQAPSDVSFIKCFREQLLPRISDYKILAAGVPFVISAGSRVAVLEIEDKRVQFRTLKGEFNVDEIPKIQEYLNIVQPLLNESNK